MTYQMNFLKTFNNIYIVPVCNDRERISTTPPNIDTKADNVVLTPTNIGLFVGIFLVFIGIVVFGMIWKKCFKG